MTLVVHEATTVAKGISEFGMMAITAAFFLVISALLWIACFKWFKTIIDNMIKGNAKMVDDLLIETRKQNDMLNDISEGLRPETNLRVQNMTDIFFELAVEKVCRMIKRVREENHIADREATKQKVRTLVRNMHEDRSSRFDSWSYRGKPLSTYVNPEWIDWVVEVILNEVYAPKVNNGHAYTNVQAVYERIKHDFHQRRSGRL